MRVSLKVVLPPVFAGLLMVALPVSGAVYRVSPEGTGDGSSWGAAGQFAAVASSAQSGDEIWLKEGTYAGGVSIAAAVTLRGGFAGTETAADQRGGDAVSTISGGSTALAFSVASGTAAGERLVITGAQQHGVTFSGAGSLALTDCQIARNGRISDQSSSVSTDGRGLYANGASASSVLTLTRCVFSENQEIRNAGFGTPGQPGADGFGGSANTTGLALYANAFKGVSLTDCTFVRNGTFPSQDLVTVMPGRGVKTGSVVYFNDTPVTAKGVRFIGNRIFTSGICAGRIVTVCGAGGGSSFTDCTWTANDVAAWLANTSANNLPDCNLHTGALVLELDKNSSAVTLSGCTFAYNVVPLGWTAGLRVMKGTANVDTSVFWGNMVTRNLFSCADIFTSTYGRVNLSNSLLSARDETALNLSSGLITLGDGMVYGDPQFGTTASAFVDGYLTKGSGVTFHADGAPYATVPKRGLKPSTDYTFMVKKASDVTAIDVTPSADGIWKKAAATAPSAPSVTAEANGDARVTFTVTAGASGDAGELTLCYGAALTGAATEPSSYPHSVNLGRLAPGLVTAFETPGVFAQGDTVQALVVASNAKGAAKGTGEVAITCETPGPWASKTLGVHPVDINPQYWEGNKNLNKFSLNLDTAAQNGRESWTRGHQVRWFRHETDPAWEAVVAEQSDTFAVGLPSDGEQPDRPLYVLLHSRGSGGHPNMGVAGVYDIMASDKATVYGTPTNMYALVVDCMESMERDFWWGGMPSAKGGEVHVADFSHPYFSYYDGQLYLGCCMCEGPTDQPFLDNAGRVCKTPTCLEHNLNGENPCLRRIMDTIEWVVRKYRIDRNRIYLGGNSMGGQGALGIGLAHGDVFAAINGNVPATIWYAAGRMGFVTPTGEDVAAEDYVPPAFDPPVCIDWSGSDDAWSRRHDVLYRNMNRFRMQITGWWGNYGHCGDLGQARGTNDLVCSFDIFKIRKNEAYPVFSNTSCDDMLPWPEVAWSGGNSSGAAGGFEVVDGGLIRREGSPAIGQVNSWFRYEVLEDTADRLIADFWIASPEELPSKHFSRPVRATTDISFRRLQAFPHAKGAKAKWLLNDGTPGKGVVALDPQLGVFTVQGVQLSQSKTRLTLTPSGDEATAAGHLAILDNPRVTSGTVTPKVQLTLDSLGGASSVPVTFEIAENPAFALATRIQGTAMTAVGATQVAALPTLDVGAVRYVRAKFGDGVVTPVFVLTAGAPDIKVTVVQSPAIPSKTYTGGTLTASVPESKQYTVVANAGGVDAGFYDVTLKLADPVTTGWADSTTDELTLRFEITRAGNAWATEPAISKGSWKQGAEPAAFTVGVGTFGGTAKMTLDGEPFTGATLPTNLALGSHMLVFTIGETPNYAGLSKSITFKVSDAATTGYIHVGGPSASDENFGATWDMAVATLARAAELVADDEEGELKEIRIAGDIKASSTTPVFTRAIVIRGGFAGTESTVEQRPLGDVSTVDGKGTCRFLDLRFAEGDMLIDSVAFTDGLSQALKITGGADATVTLTNVTISSCRYRTKDAAQYDQPGAAIWAKDLGALRLVDCRITDCGPLTMAEVAAARTKSNTGAIHLSSTPVTAVGCVFAGNRSAARDNAAGYGSTVRIVGASGASAFTRCAFYGNRALADTCAGDNADTGAFYFAPSSDAATLALDYCTFANNAAYFGGDGASLAVKKGVVTVTHSIFAGSVKKLKATSAVEISVASGATLNIDTSLVSEKATAVGGSGTVAWGGTVLEGDPLFAATAPVTWDTSSTAFNQTARSPVLDWTLIDVVLQSGSPCAGWGAYPDGEAPVPHEHSYVWTTKSEATCTAAKVEAGVCSCGKTAERTVGGPLGHDYANGTPAGHLDPTPTADGYDKVKCARCDEVQTTVLPATGGDPATDGLTILSQYETNVVCKSVTRQGTVYRHAGDAQWGGSAGEQQNTFAVIRPSAAVSGKVPLMVTLHSANDYGIWLALQHCDVTNSDNYDFFQTPSGFYGLYLDCQEHRNTDWWWGQQGNGDNGSNRNNNTGTSLSPCENRVLATLKWVMANYNIDPERVYIQGNSMGGSGALGIGMRHGDIFAAMRVQVPAGFGHVSSRMAFDFNATATSVATGTDFIRALADPPILVETSSDNDDWSAGRNRLVHNMRARKYAHMCLWGPMGHYHTENGGTASEYTGMINAYDWRSVKLHEAYPVFTDATSDSPLLDPWSTSSSEYGQRNIYFRWEVKADTAKTFQIDLKLARPTNTRFPTAPSESTANVTLRRLQNFPHAAGQTVNWSYGGATGTVTIDSLGVYTIPGLKVTPSATTLTLTAGEPPAPGHVHVWGDWTTNGVSCVTDGTRTRTCAKEDCPVKTETETVKALGHDWQKTGEDDEHTYYKCSRCEETKSEKKVADNKWFRFTMTKKAAATTGILQLGEFALFSDDGLQQNTGLTRNTASASSLQPGEYFYSWGSGADQNNSQNLFDGNTGTKMTGNGLGSLATAGSTAYYQVFTMRLKDDAAPVTKYNMCSGGDTAGNPDRAVTAWKLETKADGGQWTLVDEQVEETSGYTTANTTWYKNGGSDATPTAFYEFGSVTPSKPKINGADVDPEKFENGLKDGCDFKVPEKWTVSINDRIIYGADGTAVASLPEYYTITKDEDEDKFYLKLNEKALPKFVEATEDVKPFEIVNENGTDKVKFVVEVQPGLFYGVKAADRLGGDFKPVGDQFVREGAQRSLTLEVQKYPQQDMQFYRLYASDVGQQ